MLMKICLLIFAQQFKKSKQQQSKGATMGLLDLNRAKAGEVKKTVRLQCHNYDDAYTYLQNSHAKAKAAMAKDTKKEHPWVQVDLNTGETTVEINLHSMPLYWSTVPTGKMRKVYKPAGSYDGTDPSVSKVLDFEYEEVKGLYKYVVDNYEDGIALLDALMANEDPDFKEILTTASKALATVDTVELPNITTQAEYWYKFTDKEKTHGPWGAKDEGNKISQRKSGAMNSCKTTARNQLGYSRVKDAIVVRV
jgi:hypothetical protein